MVTSPISIGAALSGRSGQTDLRRQIANQLLGQSLGPQQINTPIQGIANLAQTAVASGLLNRAEEEEERRSQEAREGIQGALQAGDNASIAEALLARPETAELGLQVGLQEAMQPPQESFSPITDDAGNVIGQESSLTGRVVADPRAPDLLTPAELEQRVALKTAGRPETSVTVGTGLSAPLQKASISSLEKADAQEAIEADLTRMLETVRQAPDTGALTPVTLPIKAVLKDVGVELGDSDNVNILQVMRAQQNQLALRLRNPESGLGLTGNTSDRDVKFLKESVAGIDKTTEANEIILTTMIGKARRERQLAEFRSRYIEDNGSLRGFADAKKEFIDGLSLYTAEEEERILELREQALQRTAAPEIQDAPLNQSEQDELEQLRRELGLQ